MKSEELLRFAEPLPEPTFILTVEGVILGANRAVEGRLGLSRDGMEGRSLPELLANPREEVAGFLKTCARSTGLTFGGLDLLRPGKDPCALRAEGALVRPRGRGRDALIVLRLIPKESSAGQFVAINQRLESLGREIHLRERAEADLREQSELTRTTLASIGDAVIATDFEGRITTVNSVAETLTGWTAEEAIGRPLADVFRVVNETTRATVENPGARAIREGVIVGLANHSLLVAKDGSEVPIDDSAAPIRSKTGEVVGCVLVFRDITERRRAENALRAKEAELQTILDRTPFLLTRCSRDLRYRYVSRGYAEMLGMEQEEFNGRSVLEVMGEERFRQIEPHIRRVLKGEPVQFETALRLAAGMRDLFIMYVPDRDQDGEVIGWIASIVDITDRKRGEIANAKLAAIVDSSDDAVISKDLQGIIQTWNAGAARMFGYTAEEAIGRPITLLIPDDRRDEAPDILRRISRGEHVVHFETVRRRKDGTLLDISLSISPIVDPGGRIVGVSKIARDITESKRRDLQNAKLGAIVEASEDAIISKDLNGVIQTWNAGAERMFGYTAEEAVGRPVTMLIPPDRMDEEPGILKRIAQGQRLEHYETVRRCKDGRLLDISLSISPVTDSRGRVIGASKIARNITPRKRAEAEAVRRSEQVRRLADVATRLNTVHDVRSILGLLSEEARELIGAERSAASITIHGDRARSMVVDGLHGEEGWHSDGEEHDLSDLYALVCPPNRPIRATSEELRRNPAFRRSGAASGPPSGPGSASAGGARAVADASDLPAVRNWLAAPLTGLPENNVGLLQLADRTEGEFTQDDESVLVQLAQMACVAIDNAWLVEHLREANRRKDEFLATLAHELRNPLAPLRNGLQVMKLSGNDPKAVETSRVMMERQIEAMVRLIDDLMDVNRISRGKIDLRRQRVDVARIVRQAVETSQPLIETGGHALTVELPKEPLVVDGDETRLAQVLSNLLNNAAKYTEPGGRIRITAERVKGKAVISVKDTGVGIPKAMLPRVFDLFTQVDKSLEKAQGGVGIGLSLVKGLVELHGGHVEAKSEGPGKGSEFIVRLPHVDEAADPVPRPEKSMSGQLGGYRVLVADDNVDSATSLAMLLRLMGNEVHTAHDGMQAVEVARDLQPDLALLDIGMPRMNGYETCQRIREESGGRKVMMVALTGWGQDEDIRRSHLAGFDRHLVKPVEPAALEKILGSMSEKRAP